jgi:phosphoribosyl 1,2-cyclic phosphate phosphodiesterase
VRACLQTHWHSDHLDPSHLLSRSPEWGVVGAPCLHFYASGVTVRYAAGLLAGDCAPGSLFDAEIQRWLNLRIQIVEAYQRFEAGGYRVTAFPANHDPEAEPLLWAIEGQGRTLFYGTDTAALPEEVWAAFHRFGLRFDVAVLDHTYGPEEEASDHLNARQVAEHAARMRQEALLAEGGRVLATHIAHEGNPPHPDLAAYARQHGYEVAYDGLVV